MKEQPNGMRLSCGADLKISQIEDYHSRTAPPASGACYAARRNPPASVQG